MARPKKTAPEELRPDNRTAKLLRPAELRRWGDWGAEQIRTAAAGTAVTVLRDCGDGWTEVVLDGQPGFLRSEILEG